MNRLKRNIYGGVGLEWDDIHFAEDGILDALANICKGIDANGFIIWGCNGVYSGPTLVGNSAGAVYLDGEIYSVDAASFPGALGLGETNHWSVITSDEPTSLESLDNGSSAYTWQIRKAKLVKGVLPAGGLNYVDTRLLDLIHGKSVLTTASSGNFSTGGVTVWSINANDHKITWTRRRNTVLVNCWIVASAMAGNETELRISIPSSIGTPDGPFRAVCFVGTSMGLVSADNGVSYIKITIPGNGPIPFNPAVNFQMHFNVV